MSLYKRAIISISITVILLFAAGFSVVQLVFQRNLDRFLEKMQVSFGHLERSDAERNLRRVQDTYNAFLFNLEMKTLDWSRWDDAWVFAENHNQAFIKSNMIPATIGAMGYDYLLIFDKQAHLLTSAGFDSKTGMAVAIPPELLAHFTVGSPLFQLKDSSAVISGMIDLPQGPLLFSIRPITHSNGAGPIHGSIVFSQYLDSALMNKLSDMTHLNLLLNTIPPGHEAEVKSLQMIRELNQDTLLGTLLVRDFTKAPRYQIKIFLPREVHTLASKTTESIFKISQKTDFILLVSFALGGLAVVAFLSIMVTVFVVRPIQILAAQITTIKDSGNLKMQVESNGGSELGRLALVFNEMLASLEQTQNALQRQSLERQSILDAIPIGLLMLDSEWKIVGRSSRMAQQWFGSLAEGQSWLSLFGLTSKEAAELADFLDAVTHDLLPIKELHGLNPFPELQIQTGMKIWVRIRYFHLLHNDPVQAEDSVILALLEDITENRQQNDELLMLRSETTWYQTILADPDLFLEFFRESHQGLAMVQTALQGPTTHVSVARAFRHVHTLQGSASGFGITTLTETAIELEKHLTVLLHHVDQGIEHIQTEAENKARAALTRLSTVLDAEEQRLFLLLKQQATDWKAGPSLRLPLHRLREWSALLGSGMGSEVANAIEEALRMPLTRLLHRTLLWFPGMVIRSGKKAELELDGGDVKLPLDWSGMLNDILVHLLRNCMAHGIESPEARLLIGKPESGRIKIQGSSNQQELRVEVIDDGAGFGIDVESAFGLGTTSRKEYDGLAGRGVGLSAVKAMVEELGGTIRITSQQGMGSQVHLCFRIDPTNLA